MTTLITDYLFMPKQPLYIEILTYLNTATEAEEWVDLAGAYRAKLTDKVFFDTFKEEIDFLTGHNDIIIKGNLSENPDAASLQLSAQITDVGEAYLRSYKFVKEDDVDRFSTKQIILLMLSIIAGTVLLAFALAYFFG